MKKKEDISRTKGLISVIVPVYNAKEYLDRCITSITNQSYKQLEIILVDDGSDDGSAEICDNWAEKDLRICVIHSKNGGAASARNKGLDISTGEFILFVDSDDYIAPFLCKELLKQIKKYSAKCCLCGYQSVSEYGDEGYQKSNSVVSLTGKDAIEKRYLNGEEYINIINPWGKLYHWSMWKELRFTSGLYYEDLDIMPFLYYDSDKIICIPDIGYYYFLRMGSCSHGVGTDDKRYIDSLHIRKKHILFFQEKKEKDLAVAIEQKSVELIITSDCNNWIPEEYKKESRELFRAYWKDLSRYSKITVKDKIRYMLYRLGGRKTYRKFVLSRKSY